MTSIRPSAAPEPADENPAAVEAALLARLAAGERDEPLLELYQRYGRRLYVLGHQMLGDSTSAEELVQETFVRIWRSADRYDPAVAPPRAWILVLARRVGVDLQRRAAARPRRAAHLRDAGGSRTVDPLGDLPAEDELERSLIGLDVRDALQTLSDDHREVIELAYGRQLSQSEIARHLGIPIGTVKTRTYHALRAMREQLEELRLL